VNQILLTKQEKAAIRSLKRLAAKWPESLWLFSAAGKLHVMQYGKDETDTTEEFKYVEMLTRQGGVDQKYSVATIDIPNSGGDW